MDNPKALEWFARLVGVGGLALIAAVAYFGLRGYRSFNRAAEAARQRALQDLKLHDGPAPGLVVVVFHTYHGVLAWITTTEYRFWAPPVDARQALWRLHRFNVNWGLLASCGFFVAPVSYANYLLQKRSIGRQEREMFLKPSGDGLDF